jgi:uncharacterized lipoprotein
MRFDKVLAGVGVCLVLNGCHLFGKLGPNCHSAQDYQRASSQPSLKVPPGLDTPDTKGALLIPAVEAAPPPPGPKEACLDVPPRYKPAPSNKAASG